MPASEFTPELGQGYLASLLNPIEHDAAANTATARREGAAGGLSAQAGTGSRIGAIQLGAATNQADVVSQFNANVAAERRGNRIMSRERLFGEQQRKSDENFHRTMTALGYEFKRGERTAGDRASLRAAQRGAVIGAAIPYGGTGIYKAASYQAKNKNSPKSAEGSGWYGDEEDLGSQDPGGDQGGWNDNSSGGGLDGGGGGGDMYA